MRGRDGREETERKDDQAKISVLFHVSAATQALSQMFQVSD